MKHDVDGNMYVDKENGLTYYFEQYFQDLKDNVVCVEASLSRELFAVLEIPEDIKGEYVDEILDDVVSDYEHSDEYQETVRKAKESNAKFEEYITGLDKSNRPLKRRVPDISFAENFEDDVSFDFD